MLSDPATRLPPEIVAIIFEHCLPPAPQKPAPDRAPLLVAQIDHRWRSIALSFPSLWSRSSFSESLVGSQALLSLWMERSGQRPLVLRISARSAALATKYLAEIIPHAHRWRDIYIELPSASLRLVEDVPLKTPFPVLEHLAVFALWDGTVYSEQASRLDLSRAPKLRSLALYAPVLNPLARPFGQLSALRLDWLDNMHSAIAMLELCPRLELFGCLAYRSRTDPMSVSVHTHSLLAHLCVDPKTFAYLTLPVLSRVKLDLPFAPRDMGPTTDLLRGLVQRSQCTLHSLWLQVNSRVQRHQLQDLLFENPIRHLRLDFPNIIALQILMPIFELERVTPALEHLEIWNEDGWEFGPVLEPVSTRLKHGTLKSLKLHLTPETSWITTSKLSDQDLQQLRALGDLGLSVLLTAGGRYDPDHFSTLLNTTTSAESAWWSADHDL
ncbi:hypothetical protein HMN09_00206600 [Mycena chlorophos]|uniref:F-box domain-containing protein n=1 Tax=Mycena chlorophos TaxID=658473 RepID=A0A8H6WKX1_MYCCL|nr:hypothetical protein HMN09_00206600 [Mycena chlorophos]